eukprot:scaffold1314_cov386-Pavlova_lutheri.AAC.17
MTPSCPSPPMGTEPYRWGTYRTQHPTIGSTTGAGCRHHRGDTWQQRVDIIFWGAMDGGDASLVHRGAIDRVAIFQPWPPRIGPHPLDIAQGSYTRGSTPDQSQQAR